MRRSEGAAAFRRRGVAAAGGARERRHAPPDPAERVSAAQRLESLPRWVPEELEVWRAEGSPAIRLVNLIVAAAAAVALLPLGLLIALVIKLDSPGPVLYRQLRVGIDRRDPDPESGSDFARRRTADLGGRPFLMYKFRTMRHDAEEVTGPVWAAAGDGRATRVGRFLRHFRLDEIPQFWNVLKGDMSVVGPRPERPSFVQRLRTEFREYQLRQRVPPGITGWAQVNKEPDRSLDDVRVKLQYDLEYLRRRSLAFDLRIMLRTLPVMVEGETRGAGEPSRGDPASSRR